MKDGTVRGMLRRLDCQAMYVLSSGVSNGDCNGAEEGCFRSGTLRSICIIFIDISDLSQARDLLFAYCLRIVCFPHTHTYIVTTKRKEYKMRKEEDDKVS
jgi:hypothetical protein